MGFYTLIDTKNKGQGEFIRLILAQAKQQFEDKRVTDDEYKAMKDNLPTGSLPVLDSAGTMIGETNAIARYLGSLYHLYGANAIERARIDQVLDLTFRLTNYFHVSFASVAIKESSMATGFKSLREHGLKKAPEMMKDIERLLTENGGYFFAGSRMSIADISAYFFLTFVAEHDKEFAAIYAKHAALNKHAKQVAASPEIAAYLK